VPGSEAEPLRVDTGRPRPGRVYDRWPGGRNNHPVDEEPARQIIAVDRHRAARAGADRRFMHRVVRTAAEAGLHQFRGRPRTRRRA
jgi:hypothetical protein